jgi:hypothetical protein
MCIFLFYVSNVKASGNAQPCDPFSKHQKEIISVELSFHGKYRAFAKKVRLYSAPDKFQYVMM